MINDTTIAIGTFQATTTTNKRCLSAAHSRRVTAMRMTTNLVAMRCLVVTPSNSESCPPLPTDAVNANCCKSNIGGDGDKFRASSTPR